MITRSLTPLAPAFWTSPERTSSRSAAWRVRTTFSESLKPGTARLSAEVNESGALVDDIMVMRDAADRFRVSHGSGATPQTLARLAEGKQVEIVSDQDVHILSLQGPLSRDVQIGRASCRERV